MSTMYIFSLFMLIILFISNSNNVGVHYYDDDIDIEEDKDNLNVNQPIERRFGNSETTLEQVHINPATARIDQMSVEYDKWYTTSNNTYNQSIKYINKTSTVNFVNMNQRPSFKEIKQHQFHLKTPLNKTLDMFKDYIYIYDEDTESEVLRQNNVSNHIQKEQVINYTAPIKSKDHSVQFYNLEPAAERDIFKDFQNYTDDDSIWYVPENYPCWELPLLYGELGRRKRTSEVFLIFGGRLRNVIDPGYNETTYESSIPQGSHLSNRWCGVQPCYGDHTLCLFPGKDMSKLCEEGYNVQVPSILEQIALTNIINSMRNRVASGESDRYAHLPPAANMKEINYDYDLQKVSEAWLRQCLPGPAPCSALDGNTVSHLECTKYADFCCFRSQSAFKCTPKTECFVSPIIGCIHVWFWSGGKNIQEVDVQCGRTSVKNFNAVQLLWAKTMKIGCAYGERNNGDIRVVCNFAPGAPYYLNTKLYCGIIAHKNIILTDPQSAKENFLTSLAVFWNQIEPTGRDSGERLYNNSILSYFKVLDKVNTIWGVQSLNKIYNEGWVRQFLDERKNGTKGMIARLVTKYTFVDESKARCDSNESIYIVGESGSMCMERGQRYKNLCYDFRDPSPVYRSIAVAAPIALFTLILYDLFSGVVRQSN